MGQTKIKTVHLKQFGAVGDGITNNTDAFEKAGAYLQKYGGKLVIDPGTYIVGKQKLAGRFGAGYSYDNLPVLFFHNAGFPIMISGYGAIIKAANNLKYGSFNPITGKKDSIRKQGDRNSYFATAYIFINAIGCTSITILGLTLDGNSQHLTLGPAFGTEGLQLPAVGISLTNNKKAVVRDCYIHHCALDGILIGWTGLVESDPPYPQIIENVKCMYNGRQGLSWIGGNSLTVMNSEFSSTGKAINNGVPVISKPSAGIDIETENSVIKNGTFINCLIYDNAGPGVLSVGEDTHNINFIKDTFIGTTNSAAYPKSQYFSFDSCTFVGMVQRIFGSTDKSKATSFKDCVFTMDPQMSPDGKVFGDTWEFYQAQNAVFDHCSFTALNKKLPTFNTPEIIFRDCTFSQSGNANFNAAAIFTGSTKFIMTGKGKIEASKSVLQGSLIYNNKELSSFRQINN